MEAVEKISSRFCNEIVPLVKWQIELAYVIFMVLQAVQTADRAWHKKNMFYSYTKALFYAKGANIIMALCTGTSPIEAISCNCTLLVVAIVWWLVLFVPFDIFNKILNFETGDVKPLIILLGLMTTLCRLVAVDAAVTASLVKHEGSFIAVLLGTLAGNGSMAVAIVFGDFARNISTINATKMAFVTALVLALTRILCPRVVSACVVFAFCSVLFLLLELAESFGNKIEFLDDVYEFLQKIIATRDLF